MNIEHNFMNKVLTPIFLGVFFILIIIPSIYSLSSIFYIHIDEEIPNFLINMGETFTSIIKNWNIRVNPLMDNIITLIPVLIGILLYKADQQHINSNGKIAVIFSFIGIIASIIVLVFLPEEQTFSDNIHSKELWNFFNNTNTSILEYCLHFLITIFGLKKLEVYGEKS